MKIINNIRSSAMGEFRARTLRLLSPENKLMHPFFNASPNSGCLPYFQPFFYALDNLGVTQDTSRALRLHLFDNNAQLILT